MNECFNYRRKIVSLSSSQDNIPEDVYERLTPCTGAQGKGKTEEGDEVKRRPRGHDAGQQSQIMAKSRARLYPTVSLKLRLKLNYLF